MFDSVIDMRERVSKSNAGRLPADSTAFTAHDLVGNSLSEREQALFIEWKSFSLKRGEALVPGAVVRGL